MAFSYQFVTLPQGVSADGTAIMPRVAAKAGAWGTPRALNVEDPAFLLEGCMERFGRASDGYGCSSYAHRVLDRLLTCGRLSAAADDLHNHDTNSWFRNRALRPPAAYYTPRSSYSGSPDYSSIFGIGPESDPSAMFQSRVLDVGEVERMYRDLRRYECVRITDFSLGCSNNVYDHSNSDQSLHFDVSRYTSQGYHYLVYGWRRGQSASDVDVATPRTGSGENRLTVTVNQTSPADPRLVLCWHPGPEYDDEGQVIPASDLPDMKPYVLLDFHMMAYAYTAPGGHWIWRPTDEHTAYNYIEMEFSDGEARWFALEQSGGAVNVKPETPAGAGDNPMANGPAVVGRLQNWGPDWTAPWDLDDFEDIFLNGPLWEPSDGLVSVEAALIVRPYWMSNVPDWRTPLHHWIDGAGGIIPAQQGGN